MAAKTTHDHYDSLADFVVTAKASRKWVQSSGDFTGHATFEEACDLAANGWDVKASDVKATLQSVGDSPELAPTWDVAGDEVDVPAMLQGIPEHMVSYPYQPKSRPMVTVYVPTDYSGMIDSTTIERFGLAIVGGIESMRMTGHTVKVVGVITCARAKLRGRGDSNIHVDTIDLADTRYVYDATQLLFAMAHPALIRQLYFGVQDGWSETRRDLYNVSEYGGRGNTRDPYTTPEVRDIIASRPDYDEDASVWFPMLTPQQNAWDQDRFDKMVHGKLNP